jgi:hypothetical protein
MKKLLSLILIMAVVCLVFTACGNDEKEGKSPVEIQTNSNTEDKNEKNNKNEKNGKQSYVGQDDTDPYTANVPNEIIDFYIEKIKEIEDAHKAELTELIDNNPEYDISALKNLKYDLVFIDDNNTPELVVTDSRGWIIVYTYDGGKVINALGDKEVWPFGVGGNAGYSYVPKKNLVFYSSNEFAGMIRNYAFYELNGTKLVQKYTLSEVHFDDDKNNRTPDENDEFIDEPTAYYKDDKKIKKDEFEKLLTITGADDLTGTKSQAEIVAKLSSLLNLK